jgi:hypothetical protein
MINKSKLFTTYNKAKKAARDGKLDPKSVNKALGILQQNNPKQYRTTLNSCDCQARVYDPQKPCKHMVSLMIKTRISQNNNPQPVKIMNTQAPAAQYDNRSPWIETSDGTYIIAELVTGGYFLHQFYSIDDIKEWMRTERHGTMVRPTNTRGSKRGNITH